MQIEGKLDGDIAGIKISGNVTNLDDRPKIIGLFSKYLEEYGKTRFIIDLAGVPLMNSVGLGALIGSLTKIKEHSGKAAIIGYDKLKPLMIVGELAQNFHMYHDEKRALAFLRE